MAREPQLPVKNWAMMAQAGTALTGPVLLGIVLDLSLNWSPWGTLSGIFLGLIACVAQLIRLSQKSFESEKPNPEKPKSSN
jgi:F0F1-type ATP synthase assembly protein I